MSNPPPLPPKDELNTESAPAPPLPPRNPLPEIPLSLPKLPPRNPVSYTINDSVSKISLIRQLSLYSSSTLLGDGFIRLNLGDVSSSDDNYWTSILQGDLTQLEDVKELETNIISGLPTNLRKDIYFKVAQVKHTIEKGTFDELVSKSALKEGSNALKAFSHYTGYNVDSKVTTVEKFDQDDHDESEFLFIKNVSRLLLDFSDIDAFLLLLKFSKIYTNIEEFLYKVNRSLEENTESFIHIAKQGINLQPLIKKIATSFDDIKVLDFFVFEGIEFFTRLILWLFQEGEEEILLKTGNELDDYLHSSEFISSFDYEEILSLNPAIIKYENEFHLMHANSFSNNNNELIGLKDTNKELTAKFNELTKDLSNLETTHTELIQESKEYKTQLEEALKAKEEKTALLQELQQRHSQLRMDDNVKNTVKANKDFAKRNKDLQSQIDDLKASIAKQRLKSPVLA